MNGTKQPATAVDLHHADVLPTIVREQRKSILLRFWIVAGIFYMALPGTLLGFTNLMAISAGHGLTTLPAAWMEGHGHAQMFGWIGSFVLGIGFYSQPARTSGALLRQFITFLLWTPAVALRWFANIYEWHWRLLLPTSAGLEFVAILLFLWSASQHKLPEESRPSSRKPRMELWMISVLTGTMGLAAGVVFNFVECLRLGLYGTTPSFPHALDQRYLVLLGWGFLAPMVWGFSARWFHAFLAIPKPDDLRFRAALILNLAGVICGLAAQALAATVLIACGAFAIALAMRVGSKASGPAKVIGIHPSFSFFARVPYLWLMIAAGMSIWAALNDQHGGIWGASRHALTVGFAATMVFAIGPRILPHFVGVRALFSKQLMFVSLLLLQAGCTLRVSSEPLAYEGIYSMAWKTLPVSGMLELGGVLVFALNMGLTVLTGSSTFFQATTGTQASPTA